jgi:hypothetical protein
MRSVSTLFAMASAHMGSLIVDTTSAARSRRSSKRAAAAAVLLPCSMRPVASAGPTSKCWICNHSGTPARRAMRRATGTAIIDGATVETMSGLNSRRAARAGG